MDLRDKGPTPPLFDMPEAEHFARLGIVVDRELRGGHQSRVFLARHGQHLSKEIVIKLTMTDSTDRSQVLERLRVRDQAARRDDRVVPIVAVAGNKVNRIGGCLAVASPPIDGRTPDISSRSDVERMGRALARLHESLRLVRADLPVVAPLRVLGGLEPLHEDQQLLHGDFDPSNLILDDDGRMWVFDFEECGFGPVEYDIGNTLFMALFDTSRSLNQPSATYRTFREWFVGAYRASWKHPVSDLLIDMSLQARSDALRYWLKHLDEAPIGIAGATEAWHRHLRAFAGVMVR